jgi:membrane protease YdiL (CAAX protease family)
MLLSFPVVLVLSVAALVVVVLSGPTRLLRSPQPPELVGCAALSVLMTWVYQHTRGSILFAVLIHWLFNTDYLPRGTLPVLAGRRRGARTAGSV